MNKVVQIDITPVSVSSVKNGSVDVMVKCDFLGRVVCRVGKLADENYEAEIWYIENQDQRETFTSAEFKSFEFGLVKACILLAHRCYTSQNDWVVVGHEQDYDILMHKKSICKEAVEEFSSLRIRFPIFGEYTN